MSWPGYNTRRWQRLRAAALRRDGYMSRESLRYGVHEEATVVHHIYPAEEYPEYAWCLWNTISVTSKQHDTFHDRLTGKLTPAGLAWQRRVSPPPPGGQV